MPRTAILAVMSQSRDESPNPIVDRPRVAAIKRHVAFDSLATWLAAMVVKPPRHDVRRVVALEDLDPPMRDRVIEEAVRAASALDPIAEKVARHRSRLVTANLCVQLQQALAEADGHTMEQLAMQIADCAVDTFRHHLAYGAITEVV